MAEYKTPGVYVEEISTFPTSVVRVATAVPVFIGYTELLPAGLKNVAVKIKSMAEYKTIFGGEPSGTDRTLRVFLNAAGKVTKVEVALKFYLYQSLRLFYANGGGDAYILSCEKYSLAPATDALKRADFVNALTPLEEVDEPTLVLTPDAYVFTDIVQFGGVQSAVLAHCNKMQDRFGIFDVKKAATVALSASDFRTQIGSLNLKYGAAYFPEFVSSFGPDGTIRVSELTFSGGVITSLNDLATATGDPAFAQYNAAPADLALLPTRASLEAFKTTYAAIAIANTKAELQSRAQTIEAVMAAIYGLRSIVTLVNAKLISLVDETIRVGGRLEPRVRDLVLWDTGFAFAGPPAQTALARITAANYSTTAPIYTALTAAVALPGIYGVSTTLAGKVADARPSFDALFNSVIGLLDAIITLAETLASDNNLFASSKSMSDIRDAIRGTGYTLPPSGAIAGVYAAVDASRGVWKAPANVSLNGVASLLKMTNSELDDLNVSAATGKSINAIRLFQGQGTLVYGARTLAGNDNEWRYVPVRRLFIMVEESIKKATEPFVFEPNNANTWQLVKSMVENFLLGLWRDGALAGAVPKDAFYVKVGLGQTMTAEDILNGFLIVEIGMAAVRPAEFVILKFSHKAQVS